MNHVLFVCGKNRWRSPTAEQLFAETPGIECLSAGLSHDAETRLSRELVEWADTIFVMERVHLTKLRAQFHTDLTGKKVVNLAIPDRYSYMDPDLVRLLLQKMKPYLCKLR